LVSKENFAIEANTISTNKQKPFLISGPCSAETEEQVHQTIDALILHNPNIHVIRAGIWKPRTRPGAFEGIGKVGLSWLKDACTKHHKPCTVEVANKSHVEEALHAGIDMLWIGARTTVNPFGVQEIADALNGVDIPILIKNPVNPDIDLWIGAFERLNKAGIKNLTAIHRGFSSYTKSEYRNKPNWEIPIELKRRFPDLAMICDPSHICGRRDTLLKVAQKAMDLNFDGLMIESHINPDEAWSDANQQITPLQLKELLENIVLRENKIVDEETDLSLVEMRSKIDRIDNYIIELLAERMSISEEIGSYKAKNNITIYQPKRWSQIVDRMLKIGTQNGLSEAFILKLIQQINKESIRHQTNIMNKKDA
jgi:chorismate mutase